MLILICRSLLGNPDAKNPAIKAPTASAPSVDITGVKLSSPPDYKLGDKLATRQAYGSGLTKIAENNSRVIALDGDMKNSTFSQNMMKKYPERYVECFICEQNLAGVSFLIYSVGSCGNLQVSLHRLALELNAGTGPLRLFPPSPASWPVPLTTSEWVSSPRLTSMSLDPTVVCLLVRMDLPRWLLKTWPCSGNKTCHFFFVAVLD